jgi:hypothetical protein
MRLSSRRIGTCSTTRRGYGSASKWKPMSWCMVPRQVANQTESRSLSTFPPKESKVPVAKPVRWSRDFMASLSEQFGGQAAKSTHDSTTEQLTASKH